MRKPAFIACLLLLVASPATASAESGRSVPVATWILGSAGLAAGVASGVLFVVARNHDREVQSVYDRRAEARRPDEYDDVFRRRHTASVAAWTTGAVAVAAIGTGLVWWLASPAEKPREGVALRVGPTQLSVVWRFR